MISVSIACTAVRRAQLAPAADRLARAAQAVEAQSPAATASPGKHVRALHRLHGDEAHSWQGVGVHEVQQRPEHGGPDVLQLDHALSALAHGRVQQGVEHRRAGCEDDPVRSQGLVLNLPAPQSRAAIDAKCLSAAVLPLPTRQLVGQITSPDVQATPFAGRGVPPCSCKARTPVPTLTSHSMPHRPVLAC